MARVYTLPPIPGVKDLNTLMAFLMDKDEYDGRLHALVTLEEEINDLVEKVGKAEDITTLHAQAAQKESDANRLIAEAQAILKAAKEDAAQVTAKAREDSQASLVEIEMQAKTLAASRDAFDTFKAEQAALLAEWEEKLRAREALAAKIHKESQELMAEYQAKLDKLKTIL